MGSLACLIALLVATACHASPIPDAKAQNVIPWPGSLYYYTGVTNQGDFKELSLVRLPQQNITTNIAIQGDQPVNPIYLAPPLSTPYANIPSFVLTGKPLEPVVSKGPITLDHLHLQLAQPEAMDPTKVAVPLFAVPQNFLQIDDCAALQAIPYLSAIRQPVEFKKPMPVPLATVNTDIAVPAVPVFLREPLLLSGPQAVVQVPAAFGVQQPGAGLMPFHVGAVLAPIPYADLSSVSQQNPVKINMVLAVPAQADKDVAITINLTVSIQGGTASVNIDAPTTPTTTTTTTDELELKEPAIVVEAAPLVPIVSFPETVARPDTGADEDEFENREPPMAVAPGGIISSGQPTVELLPFQNSKDNPFLIAMQEEALALVSGDANSPFAKPISASEISS